MTQALGGVARFEIATEMGCLRQVSADANISEDKSHRQRWNVDALVE
jgi:hypothetical protein